MMGRGDDGGAWLLCVDVEKDGEDGILLLLSGAQRE